jgi:hypothetical protein
MFTNNTLLLVKAPLPGIPQIAPQGRMVAYVHRRAPPSLYLFRGKHHTVSIPDDDPLRAPALLSKDPSSHYPLVNGWQILFLGLV